jgi:hypothetical protein
MSPARLDQHSDSRTNAPAALHAWEQLRMRFEARVKDGNTEAGESLWTTTHSREPLPRVVVRSSNWPANYVELMFDPAQASVQCRFGPAIRRRDCEFRLGGDFDPRTNECVLSVLDALIFPDEG